MLQPNKNKPGTLQIATGIAFMALMFAGFFHYPAQARQTIMYIIYGGMGIGLLGFLFVFCSLAWRRFFPESFKKSGITIQDQPSLGLVGSEGQGSSLRITKTQEGITVTWSPMDYIFILLITFLFGPGLITCASLQYDKVVAKTPGLALSIMFIVCGVSLAAFISTLWKLLHNPRLLIKGNGIEFWRGRQLVKTLWSHQIDKLFTENHTYVYQGESGANLSCPNFILTAGMKDASQERLCISDKQAQIEQLKSDIEKQMLLNV